MNLFKRNKKGFSLIELMVVVAIIAILATIAVPSFQGFQAKARQKEGFALLNSYYTSSQATFAEFSFFPGNFVASGFAPTGQLSYRITGMNNAASMVPYGSDDAACINTTDALLCNCATMCAMFKTWMEMASAAASIGAAAPTAAGAAANATFVAVASGIVRTGGEVDEYTIDETKNLSMVNDGLN